MLEGLALIIVILGLVILRQTMKKYRKMRKKNKNGLSTVGRVISSEVTRNILGGQGLALRITS